MQRPEDYIGNHTEEEELQARRMAGEEVDEPEESARKDGDEAWLELARDAYNTSDDYFTNNIRAQVEKNIALFQSKHPQGSKYHLDSYKYRSKVFRPKTRAIAKRIEAAGAVAFFATTDAVVCLPEDQNDKVAKAGAVVAQGLLSYRLENTIPWFLTVVGALQDAWVTGICISRQEWLYETRDFNTQVVKVDEAGNPVLDDEGNQVFETVAKQEVVLDQPDIVLVPLENFRFDPASDWRDPVKTSPYLVELIPMYLYQVLEKMEQEQTGKRSNNPWRKYSEGEVLSALQTGEDDTTRRAREGKREDSKDVSHTPSLYDIVWVHRNIVKVDGEDMLFYTLGTELLLTEPCPVTDEFLHGRPYRIGFINLETHKVYPSGGPELGEGLQTEANDLVNQRLDNQKLAINRRHYAKRGTNVDWRALTSSVPGGVVLMDNLDDVKAEQIQDVTASSYQEQDRLNIDYDELMGGFSVNSAQTRRSLQETVGGMSMAQDDSNVLTEYQLRIFTESWVEPVLKDLWDMEKLYETDKRLLAMAGNGADPEVVSQLMQGAISIRVAVGFGSTSPQKRVEKIQMGISTLANLIPGFVQTLDAKEVSKEVFGALGFRDGTRFFKEDAQDPQVAALQQQLQQLQQVLQTKQLEQQTKLQIAQLQQQTALKLGELNVKLDYIKRQIEAEQNDIKRGELILEQDALAFQKAQAMQSLQDNEIKLLADERNRLSEVLMNDRYGLVPDAEDPQDGKKKPTPLQARAGGGPVEQGKPYLVGERGPEIVVPNQDGTVVPNEDMGDPLKWAQGAQALAAYVATKEALQKGALGLAGKAAGGLVKSVPLLDDLLNPSEANAGEEDLLRSRMGEGGGGPYWAAPYGLRADGTPKGNGYFGPIPTKDGSVMTEMSIGVNIDGREVQIPTLVPTLTDKEIEYLANGGAVTKAIADKAVEFALSRMKNGKSPFAEQE